MVPRPARSTPRCHHRPRACGMSGPTFDKFAWLTALREDARFTDKEVRLGMAICTAFTRRNGTGWQVGLDELVTSVPGNMSRNWLKAALQKFIRHGYLLEIGRGGGG